MLVRQTTWIARKAPRTNRTAFTLLEVLVAAGGKQWFFLTPDYAFGAAMERAASAAVTAAGGTVVGNAKFPLGTPDYSSYLLAAGSSPATIFGLSTVGGDTVNAVKQAAEFGITQNDRKIVVFLMFLPEVHAIGLASAHGLYITDGFYWDESDQARSWSKRFFERMHKMPIAPAATRRLR